MSTSDEQAKYHFQAARDSLERTQRRAAGLIKTLNQSTVQDLKVIAKFVHDLAAQIQALEHSQREEILAGLMRSHSELGEALSIIHSSDAMQIRDSKDERK